MNKLAWILALWFVLGAAGAQAEEPAPAPGIEWDMLDEEQQQLLEGQKENWESLPPGRQQAMAVGTERWLSMTPDQRKVAQERFRKWRELSPQQRQQPFLVKHRHAECSGPGKL